MKQKTHRLLSLLLCLVMVLGLMPMTAFAESGAYAVKFYCCYDDSLGKEKHSDRKMG